MSWRKGYNEWEAAFYKDGKITCLGCFDDEEEAARENNEVAVPLGCL